ncbi:porin family protein [Dokdonia sp. Hel_I_53]|uniref:porin family protein n=1 Tax=Dokdonia sp. Hel_I_53 TaxID=1566287 RepID=UPI0011991991|nr:porin family protein [Dokdonia sp. Hel_I_53]TVZ51155.1 outer membrane protein with beta-barrel domain [Dokdonia sp. Hel_I_53]
MRGLLLCTLLFSVVCSTQLCAQGVRFGFKMGANYSQISGYEYEVLNKMGEAAIEPFSSVDDGRFGLTAAFFADIDLSNKFSFQPEFVFSPQGNKFEGVRYDYLQIPLGFKIDFNNFYVIAGPQAGLKISFSDQSENFKSLDFSAFGSLGYYFNESIFIEARFTKGFLEVFEDNSEVVLPYIEEGVGNGNQSNTDNYLINNTGTNQYITLSLGYRLQ